MTVRRFVLVYALFPALLLLASVRVSSAQEVVIYASQASKVGNWTAVSDSTAAGGARLANPDNGASKLTTPLANPSSYAQVSFTASAGRPYRIWIRGKAQSDSPYNDSVFVQFSGSVNSSGSPVYRIGTTSATEINLEDCLACALQGWGWQDNGWGVLGPQIFFQTTGGRCKAHNQWAVSGSRIRRNANLRWLVWNRGRRRCWCRSRSWRRGRGWRWCWRGTRHRALQDRVVVFQGARRQIEERV